MIKNWIIQGVFFLIAFFAVERFCHKQTHGFRVQKIHAEIPFNPDWNTLLPNTPSEKKLQAILSQPFYFFNSGGESYAFLSKDGKYVIKFFKLHHMRPKSFFDPFLPALLRSKFQKHRIQKLTTLFSSCKIAYERFREGTALLYLHLNPTSFFHQKLQIFDAIGAIHHIDLDQIPFALQKRASMAYPTFDALSEAQEWEAAKKRLSSLIDLIVYRCQVGIADHDARKRNFGFIKEKAIEIDLGSFTIDENLKNPAVMKKILLKETMKLHRYIKKNHPELSDCLEEKVKQYLTPNA